MKTKTLEEVFKENQERERNRIKEQIKANKRKEKKENFLFAFITCAIIVATIALLGFICKDDKAYYQQCLENHSAKYCNKNL